MGWKFWNHSKEPATPGQTPKVKLPGPKDLSQQIGMHLVTAKKMDPDEVWNFKMVTRPKEDNPTRFDFRIYSPDKSEAVGVHVTNFNTLENHAELINFSGWIDKKSQQFEFNKN